MVQLRLMSCSRFCTSGSATLCFLIMIQLLRIGKCFSIRIQDFVDLLIALFANYHAALIGLEPFDSPLDPYAEGDSRLEFRHKRLDLSVIKDYSVRFITDQAAPVGSIDVDDEVRRHVNNLWLDVDRRRHGLIYLIPSQQFVGCDVERLPDGLLMSQEAHEAFREVL